MGDITLNSKVYAFSGVVGQATRYIYRTLGVTRLFSFLTASVRSIAGQKARTSKNGLVQAPAKAGHTRVEWNLQQVVALTPGEGSCCGDATEAKSTVYITANISDDSLPADRADLLAQIQALVSKTEFTGSITNLVQPYS